MGKPSIAFRVMLSPLVFVLGMVLLGRYALSIVAPAPDLTPPPASTVAPAPQGPDPTTVKVLLEGPNRSWAAERLVNAGYSDPAWLPAIELGLLEASGEGQGDWLRCLRTLTADPAQLTRIKEILLHDVMNRPQFNTSNVDCALRALRTIPVEEKAPMVGLVLAYADQRPSLSGITAEAVAGVRVDPLPEGVLRRLGSAQVMERVEGVGFAVSLGAGDASPEFVDAARGTVEDRVRSMLKRRRDPESARFLAWLAFTGRDQLAGDALFERDQRAGDVSETLLAVARNEGTTEQMRVGAIQFLAFRGRKGICPRLEPLRFSSSETVRASAHAALSEPRCRA